MAANSTSTNWAANIVSCQWGDQPMKRRSDIHCCSFIDNRNRDKSSIYAISSVDLYQLLDFMVLNKWIFPTQLTPMILYSLNEIVFQNNDCYSIGSTYETGLWQYSNFVVNVGRWPQSAANCMIFTATSKTHFLLYNLLCTTTVSDAVKCCTVNHMEL